MRKTELDIPFNARTDRFETISKVPVHDSTRNKLILENVIEELHKGMRAVILTERKEHIDTLQQYLKKQFEVIALSGDDTDANKADKWKSLKTANFQVLITTGQYFGEGSDIPEIDCLFLVYPFSFEEKLVQYIGRIQRSEKVPVIYDYRDYEIDYLEKMFQKRNAYYKKFFLSGTLFDQVDKASDVTISSFIYEERILIPFDQLNFRYGSVGFKHLIPQSITEEEFEVENSEMRPEFEVLKPYFAKILKAKKMKIDVIAKFVNGVAISPVATSFDLMKINREIIDSVKFQFVSKGILRSVPAHSEGLLDLTQV